MRTLLYMIAVAASSLTAWRVCGAEATNAALTFYVISEQKITGGRFIDTAAIPRAGYIGPVADLVVTNLLDVYSQESASLSIMTDTNGNRCNCYDAARPALTIALAPGEAKQFADLTNRAVRKRLLVMLGTKPLTAPVDHDAYRDWHGDDRVWERIRRAGRGGQGRT